jgi:hypothetical protein
MKVPLIAAMALLPPVPLFAGDLVFESPETRSTLIELFTSEGCSSCPPADAWVSKLKESPDLWKSIVPVVFHVDYWNGLGWADRFATEANSARQRRYAAAWRSNSVYTPGFVLNGREWRNWRDRDFTASTEKVGKLRVTVHDRLQAAVTFMPHDAASPPQQLQVELALLGGNLESDVERGENSGRKLRHDFTVLHFASVPMHAVERGFTAAVPLPVKTAEASLSIAVWITAGDAHPPLQATGGWLRVFGAR